MFVSDVMIWMKRREKRGTDSGRDGKESVGRAPLRADNGIQDEDDTECFASDGFHCFRGSSHNARSRSQILKNIIVIQAAKLHVTAKNREKDRRKEATACKHENTQTTAERERTSSCASRY